MTLTQVIGLLHVLGMIDGFAAVDISVTGADPEWTEIAATGFYDSDTGHDTIQIVQAGNYLEGRWQDHYDTADYRGDTYRDFTRYRMRGTKTSATSSLVIYSYDWGDVDEVHVGHEVSYEEGAQRGSGTMEFSLSRGRVALKIESDGTDHPFTQVAPVARVHDKAIEAMATWSRGFQVANQESPLHADEYAEIDDAMRTLGVALDAWADAVGTDRFTMASNADTQLGVDLAIHVGMDGTTIMRSSDQLELVRLACRTLLRTTGAQASGAARSRWTLAVSMVSENANTTKFLQHFLNIAPPPTAGDLFHYRWRILVEGSLSGDVLPTVLVPLRFDSRQRDSVNEF